MENHTAYNREANALDSIKPLRRVSCEAGAPSDGDYHPLDPLTAPEIELATTLIQQYAVPRKLKFNCITLKEPSKSAYLDFCLDRSRRPSRQAYAILVDKDTSSVFQCVTDLDPENLRVVTWENIPDVVPMLTPEDCLSLEEIARADERVISLCHDVGITDMAQVCMDTWSIGHDRRWGRSRHLQQGLVWWRSPGTHNQYAHPLDFFVVADTMTKEILSVDKVRSENGERGKVPSTLHNYHPEYLRDKIKSDRLKPIEISQPEGVSFRLQGNQISWAGFSMHIGFNYREGIVLSDIRVHDLDEQEERTLFYRISLAEMVVPYGHPGFPLCRRHAFDVGEYGFGYLTNSLKVGCDCKGAIRYLDAVMSTSDGRASVVKNAICIHEEDNGILHKHVEPRDRNTVSTRDRKLIISQIVTVGNYEYGAYHIFTLDGTYKFEMKLTGILNLSNSWEESPSYGTRLSDGIVAHNHQHIFSLRVNPAIDGCQNSVSQCDAVAGIVPLTNAVDDFGNAFHCEETTLKRAQGVDYCQATGRTWKIFNSNKVNPSSGKPTGYKIINNQCPSLLARPGGIIAERAAFARHSLWVVPYDDDGFFPAGKFVPQSGAGASGDRNTAIIDWVDRKGCIVNTDIVCYVQFGVTHFPRPEDFPIMPAENVAVVFRANGFFSRNPTLWVPASSS
ncbi:primary-amine oxidase [Fusarium avenaceum]|nr:primary-amine oxidase [Fusarium avenaceum]